MIEEVLVLDDAGWAAAIALPSPLVVGFWADWCVPSRATSALLAEAAHRLGGRVRLALLNVDQNPATTASLGIQGLPTLLVFQGGTLRERRVGLMQLDDLLRLLERHAG